MFVIDGNNSAKRFISAALQDDRDFESDYFLTREEVDKFKDEVKRRSEDADDDDDDDDYVRVCTTKKYILIIIPR